MTRHKQVSQGASLHSSADGGCSIGHVQLISTLLLFLYLDRRSPSSGSGVEMLAYHSSGRHVSVATIKVWAVGA